MVKVSVCIATFNQKDYIESSIRSSLNQTQKPFEIIVSDDCSTDGTSKLLDKLAIEISELKVIHQPVNLGISRNVNRCLKAAKGDFIVRLDSDDLLKPKYIEVLSRKLLDNPSAGYAHCAVDQIDQYDNFMLMRRLNRLKLFEEAEKALWKNRKGYRVSANIIMFRKKALKDIDYINQQIDYVEDFYTASRISVIGYGNVYVEDSLAKYRVWVDTKNIRLKRKLDEIRGLTKVYNDILEPAFQSKKWDIKILNRNRRIKAVAQSSCLSWSVFSESEKRDLIRALNELSNHYIAKLAIYMHSNNMGAIIKLREFLFIPVKIRLKEVLFMVRKINIK